MPISDISRLVPEFQRACQGSPVAMAACVAALLDLQQAPTADPAACVTACDTRLDKLFAENSFSHVTDIATLLRWLQSMGFGGTRKRTVSLSHSHLGWVIEHREGLPIVLAVLFLEGLARIGLTGEGVNYPGHFLVRTGSILIDPLAMQPVEPADLHNDPAAFVAASSRTLGLRMLNNVKALYMQAGQWPKVLEVLDLQLELGAQDADIRAQLKFESAEVLEQLGALQMARSAYAECAETAAGDDLGQRALDKLAEISGRSETLH